MKNRACQLVVKLFFLQLLVIGVAGTVQAVESYGTGEVRYSGWGLDNEERENAEIAALQSAIESWIAQEQKSHSRNYYKVKADIDSSVRDYILNSPVIIRAEQDKDRKKYKVKLRATLNEPLLLRKINEGGASPGNISEDTYITFIFVARQHIGKESRSYKSATTQKNAGKGITKEINDGNANITKYKTKGISVEQNQKKYKDKVLWDVSTANEIDVAMGDVFTDANLLVIDAALIMDETDGYLNPDSFIQDYRKGSDISPRTMNKALKGLKTLPDPIQFFAIGTLDIDESLVDAVTGQVKVSVSVTGQILSVKKRGAAVAKVGPVQYMGLGPTEIMAKNNALKLAAEQAAKSLVAKLSAKGIR